MPDPKAEQIAEKLVDVQKLKGSAFTHIGRCKMCGWQSMQNDEKHAKDAVKTHAMEHVPDVIAAANVAGAQVGGSSSQEKETGKEKEKEKEKESGGSQQKSSEGGQDAGNVGGRSGSSGGSGDVGRTEPGAQPQQTGASRGIGGPTSPPRP